MGYQSLSNLAVALIIIHSEAMAEASGLSHGGSRTRHLAGEGTRACVQKELMAGSTEEHFIKKKKKKNRIHG